MTRSRGMHGVLRARFLMATTELECRQGTDVPADSGIGADGFRWLVGLA